MKDQFTAMDLFSGAGGLSYGFEQAGFNVQFALEIDSWAVDTYKTNHKNQNVLETDIAMLDNSFFLPYKDKIDVLMGGPPCQGFSIAASNRRKVDDPRNTLYKHFLRVASLIEPRIILIENVKEILNYKLQDGTKIIDDIENFLKRNHYIYGASVLNCRHYGIPQDRKRFFLIAIKSNSSIKRNIDLEKLMQQFVKPEISFFDAVSDLPIVYAKQYPEGAILEYDSFPITDYQKKMRKGSAKVYNHIPMQHTEKTVEKFKFLLEKNGNQLPEKLKPRVRSHTDEISNSSYEQNHRIINGEKVSPTITASFYSSFIHPTQPRNLTVREAARLQSFPDKFVFHGKKTTISKKLLARKGIVSELHLDQFNQVGNAVPPQMAFYLAQLCLKFLKDEL